MQDYDSALGDSNFQELAKEGILLERYYGMLIILSSIYRADIFPQH
jgi:hypothetical protein